MFRHHVRHHGLVHRHFNLLTTACALAMKQRGKHRLDHGHGRRFVADDGRQIARFAENHFVQHGDA